MIEENKKKRSCNLHVDCDEADRQWKEKHKDILSAKLNADHCHDECCEDCFGC